MTYLVVAPFRENRSWSCPVVTKFEAPDDQAALQHIRSNPGLTRSGGVDWPCKLMRKDHTELKGTGSYEWNPDFGKTRRNRSN